MWDMPGRSSGLPTDAGQVAMKMRLRDHKFGWFYENGIADAIILCAFVFASLIRIWYLKDQPSKVRASWLLLQKMLLFAAFIVIQAVLLVFWVQDGGLSYARLRIACTWANAIGFMALFVTSYMEHSRSTRPSTMISVYLLISIILDLSRFRVVLFYPEYRAIEWLLRSSFLIKVLLFVAEITEKRQLLRPSWKGESPEATSGIFNRALFLWLNKLLRKGFRTTLTVNLLTPLDSELLSASSPTSLRRKWNKADTSSEDALLWTFVAHYKWDFLAGVLPRLLFTAFSLSQPLLIKRVLEFVARREMSESTETGYKLIGAYAIVYCGLSMSYVIYEQKTSRLLTKFRGSLITLLYEKTLRISPSNMEDTDVITLMSADIDRIESMTVIHELWSGVIEAGVAIWLLFNLFGTAIVAPLVWVAVCFAVGLPLATAAGNAQVPWLEAIEDRLSATAKLLNMAKPIRMTGLSDLMAAKVQHLRQTEVHASRRHRVFSIYMYIWHFTTSGLASVIGLGAYVIIGQAHHSGILTESKAFAALSLFELMEQPLTTFVDAFEIFQTVINSFRRIQEYLLQEDREDYRQDCSVESLLHDESQPLDPVNDDRSSSPAYSRENPSITASQVAAIIEGVSVGYDPETLIFEGLNFELPRGKLTAIYGPVGSGKSTILRLLLGEAPLIDGSVSTSFKRAAYCPQDAWITWGSIQSNITGMALLDRAWYEAVINACDLAYDFEELPDGDETATGTQGSRLSGGQQKRVALARALYARSRTILLDDVLSGLDRATERTIQRAVFGPKGLLKQLGSTVVFATSASHQIKLADHVIILDNDGKIAHQGTPESIEEIADLAYLFDPETSMPDERTRPKIATATLPELELPDKETEAGDHTGDTTIYLYYAKMAGPWLTIIYLLSTCVIVFGVTFPSIWVQWWANASDRYGNKDTAYWLGIYGGLVGITMLGCAMADGILNLAVLPRAANRFHDLLLTTTMRATTAFITSTDAGNTLNRFSQDLELIDSDLPMSLDSLVFQFLSAIVSVILVCAGSLYILAAIPVCLATLGLIQAYYLRTSRQLRILDIEAKAPLFSQFLETLSGTASIRAYGWSQDYEQRQVNALNDSQKPFYLMGCIQRWLTLVLDLFNTGLAVLLIAVVVTVRTGSTGILGAALFDVLTLSSAFQTLITEWTHVEIALGAIKRVRSYVHNVKDENLPNEKEEVDDAWPMSGKIRFKDVSASYDPALGQVLKRINLDVYPGEKIAICGRTGSGKSSLLSTLLRMLELDRGSITIDDVDISTVPRQTIRSRLNTIPQDSLFLFDTVRENLDPQEITSDDAIKDSLRSVGLWDVIESRGGLDEEISDDTLSYGERQLFCLARALIKSGNIILMDEATSGLDSETEDLIQQVLRKKFAGRTVISIAHKLDTVLDYDRVVLLDQGRIIETGRPQSLLDSPTSEFRKLYDSLNHGDAEVSD